MTNKKQETIYVEPRILNYFKEMIADYDFNKEVEYTKTRDWMDDSVQTMEKVSD